MKEKNINETGSGADVSSNRLLADSPTWPYVLAFAKRMEAKLEKNRHKGNREGWLHDDPDALLERVREEVCELDTAMCEIGNATDFSRDWYAERIADEAADVANFCMMLADIYTNGKSANVPS